MGLTAGIHNPPRLDAIVGGVDTDRDVVSFKQGLQRDQDLLSHSLLYLWSLRKESHNSIDFGETDNFLMRDISNICNPVNGNEVVFTGAG